MKTVKIQVALAILLGVCVAGTSSFAQPQSKKKSAIITISHSNLTGKGEADDDDDDLSPMYLYDLTLTTQDKAVPILSNFNSTNNRPNSLIVGTGICIRAGYKSIGWVQNYSEKPKAKSAGYSFGSFSSNKQQPIKTILGVELDQYGKIVSRETNEITGQTVVGVYCIRSMDAGTFFGCQLEAAKKSVNNTDEKFNQYVEECEGRKAAARQQAQPAPVVEKKQEVKPQEPVQKEEENFDAEFESATAPKKTETPVKKQ